MGEYTVQCFTPFKSTSICCLGMHNIIQRPVVVDGNVEIRPIMYLALSYDHRIIDGKEAVLFLKILRSLSNLRGYF